MRATEYGLSRKVSAHQLVFGEAWADVVRLAALGARDAELARDSEIDVRWRDVEARSEGERVDALLKMATLGVSRRVLWDRWGATPQEVERWAQEATDELERTAALAPAVTPRRADPPRPPASARYQAPAVRTACS